MTRWLANAATFIDIACWGVCFWWMHRISQRQNSMLQELQQQAESIEQLSKEEHKILQELHPAVQKIEEGVDEVKESTQS
jgi:cell division protein FtsB